MISYIIYNNLDLILVIPLVVGLVFSIYMGMKEKNNNLNNDLIYDYEIESNETDKKNEI